MPNRWFGGLLEIEINPASRESRAARASRRGDVRTALRLYASAGRLDLIDECLSASQPPELPSRDVLLAAAKEVFALRSAIDRIGTLGVPAGLISDAGDYADSVAGTLWNAARRVSAVRTEIAEVPRVRERAREQVASIQELSDALKDIRGELATLGLRGVESGEVAKVLGRLKSLAATARATDVAMGEVL